MTMSMDPGVARVTVTGGGPPHAVLAQVDGILDRHHGDRTETIAILLDVQDVLGYLPEAALRHIAQSLVVPVTRLYGIATFYKCFRLRPPGRHQCTVCLGTACHVRGAVRVLQEMERRMGIRAGEVTPDLEYGLETVNCVGACALGPVVIVDGTYRGQMSPTKVSSLLRRLERSKGEMPA